MDLADTVRPEPIDENEFRCGFGLAKISSINVLDGLGDISKHSIRMGYFAYVALTTNDFPSLDHVIAAEFAEKIGLYPKK
jgi:hypothetical protein